MYKLLRSLKESNRTNQHANQELENMRARLVEPIRDKTPDDTIKLSFNTIPF